MSKTLPPLPALPPAEVQEWSESWITLRGEGWTRETVEKYASDYALAAIEKDRDRQSVTAAQDAANLLSRYERQWHRMGELWERHQGKGWPAKEGAEFAQLRDERAPATHAALLAFLAAPQPQPVQQGPVARVRFSKHAFDFVDWIPYQGQPLKDGDLLYTSPQAAQPLTPEWYARWIRNNYQDHPNIATLCEELTKAAHGITKGTT